MRTWLGKVARAPFECLAAAVYPCNLPVLVNDEFRLAGRQAAAFQVRGGEHKLVLWRVADLHIVESKLAVFRHSRFYGGNLIEHFGQGSVDKMAETYAAMLQIEVAFAPPEQHADASFYLVDALIGQAGMDFLHRKAAPVFE